MPVCTRCSGIYTGFIISLILIYAIDRRLKSRLPGKKTVMILVSFFGIMVIDALISLVKIFPPHIDNMLRFITGFCTGWFLPLLLLPLKNSIIFKTEAIFQKSYLSGKWQFICWISAGIVFLTVFFLTCAYRGAVLFYSALSIAGLVILIAELLIILFFAPVKRLRNSLSPGLKYTGFVALSVIAAFSFILASAFLKLLVYKYL